MAVEFVRPAGAGPWLEKTRSVAVLGREALTPPVRSVGKTPLQNSPSLPYWFALETLCKVSRVLSYGSLEKLVSNPVPIPSML